MITMIPVRIDNINNDYVDTSVDNINDDYVDTREDSMMMIILIPLILGQMLASYMVY